jgi:ABC-type transport system involved in cytochrome bd biosynthesis fused ATPase/permease subunit
MGNKIKQEAPQPAIEQKPRPEPSVRKKKRKFPNFMHVFGIFDRHQIVMLMPFILFLTFLTIIYIGNSYYAERTIRKIEKTKTELRDRRAEYISASSELMFRTKQSEVAKAIAPQEIKESVEPQKKILVVIAKNLKP